jgi:transcriptional regulator with XRE-family HTH domain
MCVSMTAKKMLRKWRGSRTPQEAAELLRCHVTSIEKWETGKRRPDGDMRLVIERVAGIPAAAWSKRLAVAVEERSSQ